MADVRTNIDRALEPLTRFPIGPVNGSAMGLIASVVKAAVLAGLAGDTVDPAPAEEAPPEGMELEAPPEPAPAEPAPLAEPPAVEPAAEPTPVVDETPATPAENPLA